MDCMILCWLQFAVIMLSVHKLSIIQRHTVIVLSVINPRPEGYVESFCHSICRNRATHVRARIALIDSGAT